MVTQDLSGGFALFTSVSGLWQNVINVAYTDWRISAGVYIYDDPLGTCECCLGPSECINSTQAHLPIETAHNSKNRDKLKACQDYFIAHVKDFLLAAVDNGELQICTHKEAFIVITVTMKMTFHINLLDARR